jgi:hypothetical protein
MKRCSFFSIALLALGLFSGCDWLGKKSSGSTAASSSASVSPSVGKGEVVISFNGKPMVSEEDFQQYFNLLAREQQGLKEVLPMLPREQQEQLYQNLADSMALERLVVEWAKTSGLNDSPDFKAEAQKAHEMLDKQLALQAFQNSLFKEINITDDEARKFYEENKKTDMLFKRPPFVTTPAGVKAQTIVVATEKDAKDLAQKAKAADFNVVAKTANKSVTDLGIVNLQTPNVDAAVKSKLMSIKQFPSVEVIKGGDGKYYVVKAVSAQEATYAPFDQVKDRVISIVTERRLADMYAKRMNELKAQYGVVINTEYLKKLVQGGAQEPADLMEQAAEVAPVKAPSASAA